MILKPAGKERAWIAGTLGGVHLHYMRVSYKEKGKKGEEKGKI